MYTMFETAGKEMMSEFKNQIKDKTPFLLPAFTQAAWVWKVNFVFVLFFYY